MCPSVQSPTQVRRHRGFPWAMWMTSPGPPPASTSKPALRVCFFTTAPFPPVHRGTGRQHQRGVQPHPQCPQPLRADRAGPGQGFRPVVSLLVNAAAVGRCLRDPQRGAQQLGWALPWRRAAPAEPGGGPAPGVTTHGNQCAGGCTQTSPMTRRTVACNSPTWNGLATNAARR